MSALAALSPSAETLAAILGAILCALWVAVACLGEVRRERTPDPRAAAAADAYDRATRAAAQRARARTR